MQRSVARYFVTKRDFGGRLLRILLALGLVVTSMPMLHLADMSRDGRVDLRDTILAMQGMEQAEASSAFTAHFRAAVVSISTVAGITINAAVTSSDGDHHQGGPGLTIFPDHSVLLSSLRLPFPEQGRVFHAIRGDSPIAFFLPPPTPPPRLAV